MRRGAIDRYLFGDYRAQVIGLIMRVTTVSVRSTETTTVMARAARDRAH